MTDRTVPYGASMISYAQNAEDVVLDRTFGHRTEGFYVDVGANDPTYDSVTRHFYELGWHGINIEPQVELFESLSVARPRDVNLNIGIGRVAGYLTFHHTPERIGNSTFSDEVAAELAAAGHRVETRKVEVKTLDEVFEAHASDRVVDFLKVDAEGLEEDVFAGFDVQRWRPRIILVEGLPLPSVWRERLGACGYHNPLWDGINFFFVREENAAEFGQHVARPATVTDNYIPWRYLEMLQQQQHALTRLTEEYVARALQDRATARRDSAAVASAGRALGRLLIERPDLLAHFGTPPGTDMDGLLQWAARTGWNANEPAAEQLAPWRGTYLRLAGLTVADGLKAARSASRRLRRRLAGLRRST